MVMVKCIFTLRLIHPIIGYINWHIRINDLFFTLKTIDILLLQSGGSFWRVCGGGGGAMS